MVAGAAAGIGIGCALAGAALAEILVCFLMQRRQRPGMVYRSPDEATPMKENGDSKCGTHSDTPTSPLTNSSTMLAIEAALSPPTQDRDISSDMSKLDTAIKNHAQSYYSNTQPTQVSRMTLEERLSALMGPNAPWTPTAIAGMLGDPRSTVVAIRFILGWCILQSLDLSSPPEKSLLPPELAECVEAMKSFRSSSEGEASLSHS